MPRPEWQQGCNPVVAEKPNVRHERQVALICTTGPDRCGRLWRGRCWDKQLLADPSFNPSLMLGEGYALSLSGPQLPCQL